MLNVCRFYYSHKNYMHYDLLSEEKNKGSYKLRWSLRQGKLYPVNFQVDRRKRRQDWNGEFLETGAFYITRRAILDEQKFQNTNCTVFEISAIDSLEVDTVEDLDLANTLASANFL